MGILLNAFLRIIPPFLSGISIHYATPATRHLVALGGLGKRVHLDVFTTSTSSSLPRKIRTFAPPEKPTRPSAPMEGRFIIGVADGGPTSGPTGGPTGRTNGGPTGQMTGELNANQPAYGPANRPA